MSSMQDLSLEEVDSANVDELANKIEAFYKQDSSQKAHLAYHWERTHLFLDGQQWLVYEGNAQTGGMWRKLQPSAANEYIPRPVTNYLFDAYQTLKGYILKTKPRITVRPNTQTHEDKNAAKIAELISDCNWERLREAYNYEYAASCLIAYGTVFKKDYWDSSFLQLAKVPRMIQQPVLDPQTGQPTGGMESVQETDPTTQEPMFDEIPLGDIASAVVEPYRMSMDPMATACHDGKWIMEYSIRPLTWIVENYDKTDPGYTGKAKEVKEEKSLNNSMRRFFQLKTASGIKGFSGISDSSGGGDSGAANSAVVKEYYERPTQKYPKGRLIVVANGMTLYAERSPYEGPEQGDWHPYSECRWEIVPGRFWGKGPLDNAIEPQKRVNGIDSMVILNRKTMAVPQKLVPHGSMPLGQWTGNPGQENHYKAGPNGEKPEVIRGAGVDPTVFDERKQVVEDIKNLTGAIDILKGDRPPGVTAASALALLFEVGTGKLFPILDRWKMFIESSQKKQLKQIAVKYREPRPDFINMLLSMNRELTSDQLKRFIGADLHDNCNVVIEAGSNVPRLKAAENAMLLEVAPLGALNLQNPQNAEQFRTALGITGFDADTNKDVKRAEWENDVMDALQSTPQNKPILLSIDNHQIHMTVHGDRMKEPSFMSLPFATQAAYMLHTQEHEQAQAQQQQEQMMQAAMQAQATGQPPQPAGPPPNPMQGSQPVHGGQGAKPHDKFINNLMGETNGSLSGGK